jgi:threonine dehydratase
VFSSALWRPGQGPHAARRARRSAVSVSPSSEVAVAVALSDEFKALKSLRHVGVILSGGNVSLDHVPW